MAETRRTTTEDTPLTPEMISKMSRSDVRRHLARIQEENERLSVQIAQMDKEEPLYSRYFDKLTKVAKLRMKGEKFETSREWRGLNNDISNIIDKLAQNETVEHLRPYCEMRGQLIVNKELAVALANRIDKKNKGLFGALSFIAAVGIGAGAFLGLSGDKDNTERKTDAKIEAVSASVVKPVAKAPVAEVKAQSVEADLEAAVQAESVAREEAAASQIDVDVWKVDFEKAIEQYSQNTQTAFRYAIQYLQAYENVVKARTVKNTSAEMDAVMDMRILESEIKKLDTVVWTVTDDNVGSILVEQGKKDPKSAFNYEKITKMLVVTYADELAAEQQRVAEAAVQRAEAEKREAVLKTILAEGQNAEVQQVKAEVELVQPQVQVQKTLKERIEALPKKYQKSIADASQMLLTVNKLATYSAMDPNSSVVPSLQREIDTSMQRIYKNDKAMFAVISQELDAVLHGSAPLNIDASRKKFVAAAEDFTANPQKAKEVVQQMDAAQAAARAMMESQMQNR